MFYQLYQKDQLPLPSDQEDLNMFLLTMDEMARGGYQQYEISNFAKTGFESKHNINYWKNRDYYGLGAGAHGYINNRRYENVKGINSYIERLLRYNRLPILEQHMVSLDEKKEDMLMLGLRMLEGVTFLDYEQIFQERLRDRFGKQIDKLVSLDLLTLDKNGIRLSNKGIIYGNDVFAEFISG